MVGTRTFKTSALNNEQSHYRWDSTNKLLGRKEHWVGCKTGVTDPAGPCFSGIYENNLAGDRYCVVTLKSKSME